MKTTVEIPEALLAEANVVAGAEHTSVTALIIEALRRLLHERRKRRTFKLRKATFKGQGLQPEWAGSAWERIRDLAYEGRGS